MKSNPVKILIVDDDEHVLIELEHILEDEGYTTATAWSGQDAVRLLEAGQFDLLLIDEHLGDLKFSTLANKLRQLQPPVPRLLMCARASYSSAPSPSDDPVVCKWEHNAVKARVRSFLAA
jgi:CheY-like chemotaxis protein